MPIIKYKEYLTEVKRTGCLAKFEQILFGSQKPDGKFEKDTDFENDIYQQLLVWLRGSADAKSKSQFKDVFNELEKCRDYFDDQLKTPTMTVYRGTGLPVKHLGSVIGWKKKRMMDEPYLVGSYVYKPHSSFQSWSKSFKVAWEFAVYNALSDIMPAILQAKTNTDDWLFNGKFLQKIYKEGKYTAREEEIVHVGEAKKPLDCFVYVSAEDLNNYGKFDLLDKHFSGWLD